MKRRKILLAGICCILAVLMGSCSSSSNGSGREKDEAETTEVTETETAEESPEEENEEAEETEETEEAEEVSEGDFQEITLLDTDDYVVKITGIDPDGEWGYTWNVYVENNSEQDVTVSLDDVSVNGVMADPFWAVSVSAGMKANDEISWYQDLGDYGIEDVTIVSGEMVIFDSDTYEDCYRDDFTVTPYGEDQVTYAVRESQSGDQVLLEGDNFSITYISLGEDEYGDTVMYLYLQNTGDSDVTFNIEDCAVNGIMCDPFWASSVNAGASAYAEVSWSESTLEESGIEAGTEFTSIDLTMEVYDDETWEDYAEETITINP